MDYKNCDICVWGSKISAKKNLEASGCFYETRELLSAESYVDERVQESLKCIESRNLRVEEEKIGGIKELKCETSITELKERISAKYPVVMKIHVNIKSGETEMHLGEEQPKLKLESASQQSFTGGKTEILNVSNASPNLEVVTDSKDMKVSAPESFQECDMDIEQIGSSSNGAHKTKTLREIFEGFGNKVCSETGAKPKVKSSVDLEKTSLFRAEDYKYEKYPAKNLSVKRNTVINPYENPKPWVRRNYGTIDSRSKINRTERRIAFMMGHRLRGMETANLVNPEESIKLAHEASESAREGAFLCILALKTVVGGIRVAQKYMKIASNSAKQEGSENSPYQLNDAGEYRRILFIASEKAKKAKRRAQNAYIAARNAYKAATAFSRMLDTESGDVEDSHFLVNWAEAIANQAKVYTYKATFASLKAIKKCFREMDDFINMVSSSKRNLDELARIKKRNGCSNVVLIFAFILGCVIVGLYYIFKPDDKAYNYIYYITEFVLITYSVIVRFYGNQIRCSEESVALEEKRRRTIEEIDEYLGIMDEYFKMHNITPVDSESEDDV